MKWLLTTVLILAASMPLAAKDEGTSPGKLERATEVIQKLTSTSPDRGVPREIFEGARCVAVIPELVKGAFVVGGEHASGVASCRTSGGRWSAPAPLLLSGISWGQQFGGKSTDLVMFIMNDRGANDLRAGHVKIGAGLSAAAGPIGRSASAEAGYKAAILAYSAGKGAFVGVSLRGAELQQDSKATHEFYSRDVSFGDVLAGNADTSSAEARAFQSAVEKAKDSAIR
ncbi:MAG: lipid-binding SYLF domain-containing protein [Acidobacteria bacterium]|nr:lipid-binding SYLF domain-containing protein [Acidobacteriota bacterium]